MLECQACQKLTTEYEARLRKFNEGRCGYCGGELIPLRSEAKSKGLENLAALKRRILSRFVVDKE